MAKPKPEGRPAVRLRWLPPSRQLAALEAARSPRSGGVRSGCWRSAWCWRVAPARLPGLPVRRRLPGPQLGDAHRPRGGHRRAGCDPADRRARPPATRNHVDDGTKVDLRPDAAGLRPALRDPAPFTKRFYTVDDRPRRGDAGAQPGARLHGGLVPRRRCRRRTSTRWRQIAKTFSCRGLRPEPEVHRRTVERGRRRRLPGGQERGADPLDRRPDQPGRRRVQQGVRQACTAVSGEAIKSFMETYPSTSSPEPNGA